MKQSFNNRRSRESDLLIGTVGDPVAPADFELCGLFFPVSNKHDWQPFSLSMTTSAVTEGIGLINGVKTGV